MTVTSQFGLAANRLPRNERETARGRALVKVRRVLESFVVRLLPRQLNSGRMAGEVECVATGERVPFHDVDQLLAFCQRQLDLDAAHQPPSALGRPTVVASQKDTT